MIVVPSNELTFNFMASQFRMRKSEDFRGVMFVPDHCRGNTMHRKDVGVALAWDNFVGKTCTVSAIVQKPECFTRQVLRTVFSFPFDECGCEAVLALVDSENLKSISLCSRVGFECVHRIPKGGSHGDLIVFQMLRESCRWLKRTH